MKQVALYQMVHCLDGRPRLVAEHAAALDRASRRLFNRSYLPDVTALTAEIAACVVALGNRSEKVSRFVRMELTDEGRLSLSDGGLSLYRGYAVRALSPVVRTLRYDLLLDEWTTTAAEATVELARSYIRQRGADDALRCDEQGVCQAVGDGQLFAMCEGLLCCSEWPQTPHAALFVQAAECDGLRLHIRPIRRNELARYDELFTVDHWGITRLAECDRQYLYQSLRVARLAATMEQLVKAR